MPLHQPTAKILKKLDKPFVGVCYAGVKEFIYPISTGKETIGFISVSGYQADDADSYVKKVADEYSLNHDALKDVYLSLKKEIPPCEYVDTLLLPLCKMLELAYRGRENLPQGEESLPEKAVKYVTLHKNDQITSEDMCKELYCSRTYLSAQFNKYTGMSIREYINKLRVEDAKLLLKNSSLSITEIALSVGYSDSNYFSNVFKKITKTSPIKYRKEGI